jgi:fructose-1,6-bisphosphatase/inositol monophosphatase family enzyme
MREAAAEAIVPRFRNLGTDEVQEKTPGEAVTAADREAEAILSRGLLRLLPGSCVIGEEGVAEQATLLDRLGTPDGPLWLVDPLDGTHNFIMGEPPFAVMTALVMQGETLAAWLLDPLTGSLAMAERGAGAVLDGRRVRAPARAAVAGELRGAVLTRFLPDSIRAHVEARADTLAEILPGHRCAGREYPAVALGEQDLALFWRTLPWDHAPGALFLTEAGGRVARLDGTPYRPADRRPGLLAACSEAAWHAAFEALLEGAPQA